MIRLLGTAHRRDDFTPEAFMRYWLEVHAPLSARRPGLRGYVVAEIVRRIRGELAVDGFVEQWFDDEAAYAHARRSPEAAAAWADLERYARPSGTFWVVNEHVLIPPAPGRPPGAETEGKGAGMIKAIGTAYRRDDFTPEEFMRYWLEVHAPISAKAPGLRGYVVSEVVRKLQGELETEAFVEQWFDDEEAFERAARSPELAAAWEDVPRYAKTTGTFWLVKEHILIPPPARGPGLLKGEG